MPIEFALPDLGENIENGDVVSVLVAVGDMLVEDQPVIELETDKAVIEVPSSVSGTVSEILVQQGDTVTVGQVIIKVETGTAAASARLGLGRREEQVCTGPKQLNLLEIKNEILALIALFALVHAEAIS